MYLFSDKENKIIERIIYAIMTCVVISNFIILELTELSVLWEKRYPLFALVSCFLVIALIAEIYRKKRCASPAYQDFFMRIAFVLKRMSEILITAFICAIFSYLVQSFNFPMQDEMFNSWDQALGLYWLDWLEFIKRSPVIAAIWCFAYKAALPQIIGVVVVLGFMGKHDDVQLFIFLFLSTLIITMIISFSFPALAAYYHYNITPDMIEGTSLAAPYAHIDAVKQLRSGEMMVIDPDNIKGLITFPSFHASLAVMFMICLRTIKFVNIASYILNTTMIIATPINGGHYFVDVIAGCIIVIIMFYIHRYIVTGTFSKKNFKVALI